MKYYYLFGSAICDLFSELDQDTRPTKLLTKKDKNLIKEVAEKSGYDLFCFDAESSSPTDLLARYDGWNDYMDISEVDYNLLTKILNKI